MMSFLSAQLGNWRQCCSTWLASSGLTVGLLGASFGLFTPSRAQAAESLVLTFGGIAQTIQVEDLATFAEGGEMAPSFSYIVKLAKLDPETVRSALTQEVKIDFLTLSNILNTLPGEYLLFELSQIFRFQYGQVSGPRSQRANYRSMRGALLISAAEDDTISLLEFLQNYPTDGIYIDGMLLLERAIIVGDLIDRVGQELEVPLKVAQDLLEDLGACECEAATTQ